MKTFDKQYFASAATKARRKQGVPSRAELQAQHAEQFIIKANIQHNGKYSYKNVEYVSSITKVNITCSEHGDFAQTPSAHMRGQGCPNCAHVLRVKSRKNKTTEQFIIEANIQHDDKYSYADTIYVRIKDKVIITCPEHGNFEQEAKAHLRGQGCPVCANTARAEFHESKGETAIREWLEDQNVEFTTQQMFDGLVDKYPLRFDFYIPSLNLLIEFDGQQHYEFVKKFHKDIEGFEQMKNRDTIKTEYAVTHNIKLERILWNQEKDIPTILERIVGKGGF